MVYDKNTDYQAKINEAVKNGDYASASRYEQARNEKIKNENLSYDTTNKYTKANGVDDDTYNKQRSTFNQSSGVSNATNKANTGLSRVESLTSDNIISNSTWKALNKEFVVPKAVTEADEYLAAQLEKIQSGKTSYTDRLKDMMDQITGREKFSYDVDTDPLFQQALASAMNSGKTAMQDTIGQASALTGGYGSTYATTAGNQAYNAFIEDAYDNLPQYYQMAMEAYQMEGDEMYRQYSMLADADSTEYNRNVTAYDATYQHRNQMYNEAYTQYRDEKADAFAMANLKLSEHGQQVSDAYTYYSAASEYADTLYAREYAKWSDEVNQAMQYAQMLNSDYWTKTNFDESVRQYEQNFAEDVRQYNTSLAENQRQFNENMAEQRRQHNEQMSYNYAALNKKNSGSSGGGGGSGSNNVLYDYTAEDLSKASKSKAVSSFRSSVLTESEFKRRGKSATINGKTVRYDSYNEYIDAKIEQWNKKGQLTETETAYLVGYYFR